MKFNRILTGIMAGATLLLGACSDDESVPKEQLSFGGETITLKEANLYLTDDQTLGETHLNREYVLTDGTFNDGTYTNATYFVEIEFTTPEENEEFKPGKYPQWYDSNDALETNGNFSYVYAYKNVEDNTYFSFETLEEGGEGDPHSPVTVSGGFDDGETMTIKFSGSLNYRSYDEETEGWVNETVSGKFYFKGKVEDVSSTELPTKRPSRRASTL